MKKDSASYDNEKLKRIGYVIGSSLLLNFIYDIVKYSYPFVWKNIASWIISSSSFLQTKYYTPVVRIFFSPSEGLSEVLVVIFLNTVLITLYFRLRSLIRKGNDKIEEHEELATYDQMSKEQLLEIKNKLRIISLDNIQRFKKISNQVRSR